MIKDLIYSIMFNHPDKPNYDGSTWSVATPDRLEFKDLDSYLQKLKDNYKAIRAYITVCTIDIDEEYDGIFDFDDSIKDTEYVWDGKTIQKK